MIKADLTIQQTIRGADFKAQLHSVFKTESNTVVGYKAEVGFPPAMAELDELAQLDEMIEKLTDLRKIWYSKTSTIKYVK